MAKRLVLYQGRIYEVLMPYSHWLELKGEDGTVIQVGYADAELDRLPNAADLEAARAVTKRKR